jgi:hypothetical protein
MQTLDGQKEIVHCGLSTFKKNRAGIELITYQLSVLCLVNTIGCLFAQSRLFLFFENPTPKICFKTLKIDFLEQTDLK